MSHRMHISYLKLVVLFGVFALSVQCPPTHAEELQLLAWDDLGASFSTSPQNALRIGDERFPIAFRNTTLASHTLSQVERIFDEGLKHLDAKTIDDLKKLFICQAVVNCRPIGNRVKCSPIDTNIVDENGVIHKGSGILSNNFGKGPAFFRYGIFVFRDYCPWDKYEGCYVELKDVVLRTDTNTIYLKIGSRLRSATCWFSFGQYEFTGEAEACEAGLKLLSGTKWRQTGKK